MFTAVSTQADLYGDPRSGCVCPDANAGHGHLDPAGALQRDESLGQFATRTKLVTEKQRTLGASLVLTPEDAATALAYLSLGAQEYSDALLTDATELTRLDPPVRKACSSCA